jgi:hypothetical protein
MMEMLFRLVDAVAGSLPARPCSRIRNLEYLGVPWSASLSGEQTPPANGQ